jgi:hypothetical protein
MAVLVTVEEDLWDLLEHLVDGDIAPGDAEIRMGNWRPELLYFPDEPVGHSISPSSAKAITEFHASLSRAYALMGYGEANPRRLSPEDRERLEITVLVIAGSSGLELTPEALSAIIQGLMEKMTGDQVTLSVIVFTLLYFSSTIAKVFITKRAEVAAKSIAGSTTVKLAKEETERVKLLSEAMERVAMLKTIANYSETSKEALLRPVRKKRIARVLGELVTGDQARAILVKERAKGVGRRLDGRFKVIDINNEAPDGFDAKLESIETGEEIGVSIHFGELPDEDIMVLFDALYRKTAIFALVNAILKDGKVESAVMVRAEHLRDEDGEDEVELV